MRTPTKTSTTAKLVSKMEEVLSFSDEDNDVLYTAYNIRKLKKRQDMMRSDMTKICPEMAAPVVKNSESGLM